jgi:phenylalanyl-tRNA synthetase alpha subunit
MSKSIIRYKGMLLGIEENTSWKYVSNLGINFKYCREKNNTAEDFIEQARIKSATNLQKNNQQTKSSNNSNTKNNVSKNKTSNSNKITIDATTQQQFTSCAHCSHHTSSELNKCMMCIHFTLVDNFTPKKINRPA